MNDRLDAIRKILCDNELPLTWRAVVGDTSGAERSEYNDVQWPTGWRELVDRKWDTAWLRARLPRCPLITGSARGKIVPGGIITVWIDGEKVAEGFQPEIHLNLSNVRDETVIAIRSQQGALASEHEKLIEWECDRLREIQRARRSLDFVRKWRGAVPNAGVRNDDVPNDVDAIDSVLRRYADAVDPATYEGAPSVFWQDVQAATEILCELDERAKRYTVHIVPHSHVDLAWGWTYDETKRISRSLFDTALQIMNENPEYTFVQDQPPMYEPHEESATEEAIRQRIAEGRWDIPGSTYSEPESFMTGGESWVRHLLYTKRYFRERFGKDICIHWAPDNFSGHTNTLPQIWWKCGVRYFCFGNWYQVDHSGQFLWEGLDGTRIFAHYFTGHYDSAQNVEPDKVIENTAQQMKVNALERVMLLDGDDLTPPWAESPDNAEQLRDLAAFPKVVFSTPHRFFDDVDPDTLNLRVVQGEFVSTVHHRHNNVGAYTTFVEVKRRNRQLEWLLRSAEALGAFAVSKGYEYPSERLSRAWKGVLLNQMHDIFPGTAIHEAYTEAYRRYDETETTCEYTIERAANSIARDIDTRGDGIPVVLFNTLGWDRSDAAEIVLTEAQSYCEAFDVVDDRGQEVPVQVIESTSGIFDKTNKTYRILALPESIPASGYRTLHLTPRYSANQIYAASMVGPDGLTLDNDYVRVRINPHTGWIASIFDKRLGRNILRDGREACVLETRQDMGNPWHLAPEGREALMNDTVRVDVVENGDVRAAIRVTTTWHDSEFVQEFRIYRNSPHLEMHTKIDFHEENRVVQALIPVDLPATARWTCEVPWGAVERGIPDSDRASQTWVDIDTGEWGVALLNNGRYGHSRREDGTLTLTLVRSVVAHKSHEQTDIGRHEFTYAILPHAGRWEDSDVVAAAHALNSPIIPQREIPHEGTAPKSASMLRVEQSNIVLAAEKKAEDDSAVILHLYETTGRETNATISFASRVVFAQDIDLMEWERGETVECDGHTLRRMFRPWEIVALRIEFAQQEV